METVDLFGANPFGVAPTAVSPPQPVFGGGSDAFGMPTFSPALTTTPYDFDQQIFSMDRELMDLQVGSV